MTAGDSRIGGAFWSQDAPLLGGPKNRSHDWHQGAFYP